MPWPSSPTTRTIRATPRRTSCAAGSSASARASTRVIAYVLVEDCYFQGKYGDNDDIDLWGESTPPCVIRNNLFDLPEYDDRINPTRCSAIIEGNVIMGSNDHGMVLRDKGSPIVMNNLIIGCSTGGIAVENSCTATLINNTIVNCGRGLRLFDLGRWDAAVPPQSRRRHRHGHQLHHLELPPVDHAGGHARTRTIADRGSHVTILHSDIQGGRAAISVSGQQSTVVWGEGNIDADPLFVECGETRFPPAGGLARDRHGQHGRGSRHGQRRQSASRRSGRRHGRLRIRAVILTASAR